MLKSIQKITILGSGNVATHIGEQFRKKGILVDSIWGRNKETIEELALKLECRILNDLHQIPIENLVLICINDDQIQLVLNQLPATLKVAYTSGSVTLQSLSPRENLGVFYPLQSFTKIKSLNFDRIPLLIEANNAKFTTELVTLAKKISDNVSIVSSLERKHLHLGAVLVNNFINHLVFLAQQHLEKNNIDWELLKPLLNETFTKLNIVSPFDAQTGPARRNDFLTMEEHLSMLTGNSKDIYEIISKSIFETYKLKND